MVKRFGLTEYAMLERRLKTEDEELIIQVKKRKLPEKDTHV